jgi:hypothetical protein
MTSCDRELAAAGALALAIAQVFIKNSSYTYGFVSIFFNPEEADPRCPKQKVKSK